MKLSRVIVWILFAILISPKDVSAYGITSISGSGWSGTLNYGSNSEIYVCYSSNVTISCDVPTSSVVGSTTYYRKWQTSNSPSSWFTTSGSGSGYATTSSDTYYRCVQRSTGGVVLAGSETPWVHINRGPSYVQLPSALSTTNASGTEFTAKWTTSSTANGPNSLDIRHYLWVSSSSGFDVVDNLPGFSSNGNCNFKLITACSSSSAAISGCTNPSTPVSYTVTGVNPGTTYYWRVLAQSYHEGSSNGDVWCGVQSSYTGTQTVVSCEAPQITTQPVAQTVCAGNSVTFSVIASGTAPLSYQWRKNGSNITNATNSSYTINPVTAADDGSYTVYISNTCGNVTSASATLTVETAPVITAHPSDITNACAGSGGSFNITATGSSLNYQWQVSTDGGNTYTNITTAGTSPVYSAWTTSSLGISNVSLASSGYKYRCVATSSCLPNATSNAATLTVSNGPDAVTVIGDGTICGSTTLTASGGTGGTIYYQGTTSGGTSVVSPSSSQTVTASGTYYFRSFDGVCWGPEGSTTVSIGTMPGAVIVSGGNTQCGGTVTLTASGGTGGTIYFQGTTSGGTSTYTPSSSQTVSSSGTYYFRANNLGCWGVEGSAIVVIDPPIGSPAFNLGTTSTRCQGVGSVTYTATSSNSTLTTYTLDATSLSAGNTIDISTGIVSYTAGWNGISVITVTAYGCDGPKTADHIVMTNPILPVGVSITKSPAGSVCSGTLVTFTANPTNGGTSPQYQWMVNGLPVGTNSSTYSSASLIMNDQVSCQLTSNALCVSENPATSNVLNMIVKPSLIADIDITASANPACSHSFVTFTATPTNGGTSPIFLWRLNGSIVGGNSSTYSNNLLLTGDNISCELTSNEGCVLNSPVTSDFYTMTVSPLPIANAGADGIYSGTPVQIGSALNGPGTISWSPASGLNNPSSPQPTASPAITTTYTLTVNNNGCEVTDDVTIVVAGSAFTISGKTRYLGKALTGNPAPAMPTYEAAKYDINKVIVILKTYPAGAELQRDTSNASGVFQFNNVVNGSYILSYDKYAADTMQFVNQANAVDVALVKYFINYDPVYDPSRNFSAKHKSAANIDNNGSINAVDVGRMKAKIVQPYMPSANFPKGNWVALDTTVVVAGADLNLTLLTIAYGDYDASSTKYKDSVMTWSMAKSLPSNNIISASDEAIITNHSDYFEVPLSISAKMNELSALGLELTYPLEDYQLVSATMPKTKNKNKSVEINPTLEEIIVNDNDLLVTDIDGVIRVVFATTDHFDVVAGEELIRLGFRSLHKIASGEINIDLSGTGIIANQYGMENDDIYLSMPKILVQGSVADTKFDFTAYPNPFSGDATLTYSIPENGHINIKVFNALGEVVAVLVNQSQAGGKYVAEFSGKHLPAGMYTVKLEFEGSEKTQHSVLKMIRQ